MYKSSTNYDLSQGSTTDASSGTGTAYPFVNPEVTPGVYSILIFCVMLCRKCCSCSFDHFIVCLFRSMISAFNAKRIKRVRKPKGQFRMDNLETKATLGT